MESNKNARKKNKNKKKSGQNSNPKLNGAQNPSPAASTAAVEAKNSQQPADNQNEISCSSKTDLLAQLLCNLKVPQPGESEEPGASGGQQLAETKNVFLNCIKDKQSEIPGLPPAIIDNLQKLFSQDPIADIDSSDDGDEYIEYVYKPRKFFLVSICHHCKSLLKGNVVPCNKCHMIFYCSTEHRAQDKSGHKQFCSVLSKVAKQCGGHIFKDTGSFTPDDYRSYRLVTIRNAEELLRRKLQPFEQEVILFPRHCCDTKCREVDFDKLQSCGICGQIAFCKDHPEHLSNTHEKWCKAFDLFQKTIEFQEKFGKIDPSLPTKVLKDFPAMCTSMKKTLEKLSAVYENDCEYAAMTQIATGPLTAWYGLKLCDKIREADITVHLIGAEIEFEVNALHKWELFFMHMTPSLKNLHVVFIGPELNPNGISFDALTRTKCCRVCRKNNRTVKYHFENRMYHDYCKMKNYLQPNLICFFNPGLYRSTGFRNADTWPETIDVVAQKKCPVIVTSYTEYESPLDLSRFLQEAQRRINVVLPPVVNPFASEKPERNFISDDEAPIMFKNYFCFVVE